MSTCPLVHSVAIPQLPRLAGRTLATLLAFGMGVMFAVFI
ncbi:hypothetical protein BH10BDE1_BH10BDE1_27100 [soil metagenome]